MFWVLGPSFHTKSPGLGALSTGLGALSPGLGALGPGLGSLVPEAICIHMIWTYTQLPHEFIWLCGPGPRFYMKSYGSKFLGADYIRIRVLEPGPILQTNLNGVEYLVSVSIRSRLVLEP